MTVAARPDRRSFAPAPAAVTNQMPWNDSGPQGITKRLARFSGGPRSMARATAGWPGFTTLPRPWHRRRRVRPTWAIKAKRSSAKKRPSPGPTHARGDACNRRYRFITHPKGFATVISCSAGERREADGGRPSAAWSAIRSAKRGPTGSRSTPTIVGVPGNQGEADLLDRGKLKTIVDTARSANLPGWPAHATPRAEGDASERS